MLLGYSFENRPNRRVLGTAGSVMTISLSMNKRGNKIDWSRSLGFGTGIQRLNAVQAEASFLLLYQALLAAHSLLSQGDD